MALRTYPANAPRGGTAALVGNGSSSDVFTFNGPVQVIVQNDTGATIYVAQGGSLPSAATQGDEAIPAGAEYVSPSTGAGWVSIYGAAGTKVNGTVAGNIVVYGAQ